VTTIEVSATHVLPGEEIIVIARVSNIGNTTATVPVSFVADGLAISSITVTLAPGQTDIHTFRIRFSPDQTGYHTITVANSPPVTIFVEGPRVTKLPEQFFDSNGNGRLDDSEILTALDYWIKQRPVPDIGVLSDLQILSLLDKWIKGTRIAGQ
jgi:hypothetical protein